MKKHILVIMTDQQRYDTISALGNPYIQTPNLDSLLKDSIVYDHCITPSPVCVPARLSIFSGQYPARTGCNNNNTDTVYSGKGFYARITEKGYKSCCVGKMHYLWDSYGDLGFEIRHTQEELANPLDDYTKYIRTKYPWVFDYHGMRSEMYYVPQVSQISPQDHPTQWVGDKSVDFILNSTPDDNIFLFTSFIHPHPPYCPPSPWQKLYREDPPNPFYPDSENLSNFWDLIGDRCSCDRLMMTKQDILRAKNFYYACISFVDYQVGRIIAALKSKGMYESTLILFTSDHGDMMGDYNAIGKRTMMDSSCRVPFILRYPGLNHERRSKPCSLVDIAPTLLNFAEVDYDSKEFDGIDLIQIQDREYVFSQHDCGNTGTYMITDGNHKLVYRAQNNRYYFFESVPEQKDTYNENHPIAKKMKKRLDDYISSDRNIAATSNTYEPVSKIHPHLAGRMDHSYLHNEEKAAIPHDYKIDLD